MKCEECLIQVEEYLESGTGFQYVEQAFAHISGCDECGREYEYLQKEQEVFSSYQVNIEATPAVWYGLQARIKEEESAVTVPHSSGLYASLLLSFKSLSFNPLPVASLALLLAVASIGLLTYLLSDKGVSDAEPVMSKLPATAEVSNPAKFDKASEYPKRAGNDHSGDIVINPKIKAYKASVSSSVKKRTTWETQQKTVVRSQSSESGNRSFDEESSSGDELLNITAQYEPPMRIENLKLETDKQVESAQLLLRSFRNTPLTEGEMAFAVAYDKRQARKLLQRNVVLRRSAESRGSADIEEVLGKIEQYLLDIANLRDNAAVSEVRAIKNRILEEEIVATLQVY